MNNENVEKKDKSNKSLWSATKELIKYEIGDKTFVIVLLFVLGWSNPEPAEGWNKDNRPGYAVFADGRMVIRHRFTDVSPIRIFILAAIGTLWTGWSMTGKTTPGKENKWTFESAGILVFLLLNYAFKLMSAHFAIVTRLEAEYEQSRGKKSVERNQSTKMWAENEIKFSRLFNDAHQESVFSEFQSKNEGKNIKELTDDKKQKFSLFKEFDNQETQKLIEESK